MTTKQQQQQQRKKSEYTSTVLLWCEGLCSWQSHGMLSP
jgi:hypothetical protein